MLSCGYMYIFQVNTDYKYTDQKYFIVSVPQAIIFYYTATLIDFVTKTKWCWPYTEVTSLKIVQILCHHDFEEEFNHIILLLNIL